MFFVESAKFLSFIFLKLSAIFVLTVLGSVEPDTNMLAIEHHISEKKAGLTMLECSSLVRWGSDNRG